MKRLATPAALLLLTLVVQTADYEPRADRNGISEASVRGHMEFLASDAMNGRGSGTRDEWIAAEYIASHLRRWGLQPLGDDGGFVRRVAVERAEVAAPPALVFADRRAVHMKDIVVTALAGGGVSGPLQIFREDTPVTPGAVLLLPETSPPGPGRTAAAALVLSPETNAQRGRREGQAGAAPARPLTAQWIVGGPRRAAAALGRETYAAIAALPEGTTITLDAETGPAQTAYTWNVVARLAGTAPGGEAIVLSAHLDHIGNRAGQDAPPGADTINNGADDDATGTVAVMEIAQAMARAGKAPRRTVIFAWFGSEEAGGLGSRHFIDQPPVPLERIVANLQFEMIGRPDAKVAAETLWLTGYERSTLGPELARRGARLVQDPHPEQSFFTRSDNIQFARRGVVAHTVSSFGLHTDYHRPSDEVQTIDFRHMTTAIRSMVGPIRWLANSSFRPDWRPGMRP